MCSGMEEFITVVFGDGFWNYLTVIYQPKTVFRDMIHNYYSFALSIVSKYICSGSGRHQISLNNRVASSLCSEKRRRASLLEGCSIVYGWSEDVTSFWYLIGWWDQLHYQKSSETIRSAVCGFFAFLSIVISSIAILSDSMDFVNWWSVLQSRRCDNRSLETLSVFRRVLSVLWSYLSIISVWIKYIFNGWSLHHDGAAAV